MTNMYFDNDKFISIVKSHPAIWDNSDHDYSDMRKREKAWREVMSMMFGDEVDKWEVSKKNHTGKELQKKWRSLRNSFSRELYKRKKQSTGCGKSWRTYIYYDQLSFLLPTMRNGDYHSIEEDENENSSIDTPVADRQYTRKTRREQIQLNQSINENNSSDTAVPDQQYTRKRRCEQTQSNQSINETICTDTPVHDQQYTRKRRCEPTQSNQSVNENNCTDTPVPDQQHARKRRCEQTQSNHMAEVLWRHQNEDTLESDPDRLFLLSLLEDFKAVPDSNKANVKIAMIKAINDARVWHHKCSQSTAVPQSPCCGRNDDYSSSSPCVSQSTQGCAHHNKLPKIESTHSLVTLVDCESEDSVDLY